MKFKANPNPTNSEMDSKTILKPRTTTELTDSQRDELIYQYVGIVVDGMEIKDLVRYATDQLTSYYNEGSLDDLKEDVDNYDEDLYNELVDNVTNETVLDVNNTGGKY